MHFPHPSHFARSITMIHRRPGTPFRAASSTGNIAAPAGIVSAAADRVPHVANFPTAAAPRIVRL